MPLQGGRDQGARIGHWVEPAVLGIVDDRGIADRLGIDLGFEPADVVEAEDLRRIAPGDQLLQLGERVGAVASAGFGFRILPLQHAGAMIPVGARELGEDVLMGLAPGEVEPEIGLRGQLSRRH